MDSAEISFDITANIDGHKSQLKVVQLETTDGVPYYSCQHNGKELAQLRNETYGKWEQLWGDLDDKTIKHLGQKIEEKISPP